MQEMPGGSRNRARPCAHTCGGFLHDLAAGRSCGGDSPRIPACLHWPADPVFCVSQNNTWRCFERQGCQRYNQGQQDTSQAEGCGNVESLDDNQILRAEGATGCHHAVQAAGTAEAAAD